MDLANLLAKFNNVTEKGENFINAQQNHNNQIKSFVKDSYDFVKNEEKSSKTNALPELIVDNFDLEQIWQQVELQNEEFLSKSLTNIPKFVVGKNRLLFYETQEKNVSTDTDTDNEENDEVESDTGNISNSNAEETDLDDSYDSSDKLTDDEAIMSDLDDKPNTQYGKRSIVDDQFFKLHEMEEFLKSGEKVTNNKPNDDSGNDSETKEGGEEIDFFASESDLDDEEDLHERNPRYKDFFRANDEVVSNKRQRFEEDEATDGEDRATYGEDEDTDGEDKVMDGGGDQNNDPKTTFELRQDRLKNKIQTLENIALSDKPWQLHGEVTAENRPINSLLQEVVEFDVTSRPAPIITEETTLQLEDIIRQRIKDRVFDSVERKERPVDTPTEYKKKLVLDQEKSKESLAQIYEKEYLQQKEELSGNTEDKEEEEPELHKEVKKMMDNLFHQLNAFANLHFTPKPAAPELRIVNNLPVINMEEVAAVGTSDATLLAPEEVKRRIRGDLIGKSERTDTDKNRERRKKKIKQRIHAQERKKREDLINKMNPGLGNKYSKEKARKQLEKVTKEKNVDKMEETADSKATKSSTAFFRKLEEEVRTQVQQKSKNRNAKKIKL